MSGSSPSLAPVVAVVTPRWVSQFEAVGRAVPAGIERGLGRIRSLDRWAEGARLPVAVTRMATTATRRVTDLVHEHTRETIRQVSEGLPFASWLFLTPVIAFILLQGSRAFRNSTIRALPEGHLQWRGEEFFHHVNGTLAGYLRGQLAAALFIGVTCAIAFALFKVPYALLVGLGAGLLEFVPVIGPLSVVIAIASLTSGTKLLVLLVFLAALRMVQDYVVYPRLLGRGMHLHPMLVISAILIGARIDGIVGVIAAVPVMGVVAVGWRQWRDYRAIVNLVRRHEAMLAAKAAANASDVATAPPPAGRPDERTGRHHERAAGRITSHPAGVASRPGRRVILRAAQPDAIAAPSTAPASPTCRGVC